MRTTDAERAAGDAAESRGQWSGFKLVCAAVGLLFLVVTQYAKIIDYDARGVFSYQDFPQYYMGGVIARAGAWESLYPIPIPGNEHNPGAYDDSIMRPHYAQLAAATRVGEGTRFIQPPPMALLLMPLALMPVDVAYALWIFLLCLAAWGIGLQAARIYEMCEDASDAAARRGRATPGAGLGCMRAWLAPRASGLIILIICTSPQAHRWVRSGNMAVVMGWLTGAATLALVRRRTLGWDSAGAVAIVLGALAKYSTLVLVPLYLAMRRWRAMALMVLLTAAALAAPVAASGSLDVYRTFGRDIAPTLGRSFSDRENQCLEGMVLRIMHRETLPLRAALVLHSASAIVLGVILIQIFSRPVRSWQNVAQVFCAAAMLVTWLLVFGPVAWVPYFAHLAPFWGWLVYQAARSRARFAAVACMFVASYMPLPVLRGFRAPEPIFSYPCLSLMLTLVFCMWVMFRDARQARGAVWSGSGSRLESSDF